RTTVEQIEQYALEHELSLWSALKEMLDQHQFPGRAESALSAFRAMIEELSQDIETRPGGATIEAILSRTGYRKMLEDEGTEEARGRLANIEELQNAALDASERGETIREFLDHAALVSDADSADERA